MTSNHSPRHQNTRSSTTFVTPHSRFSHQGLTFTLVTNDDVFVLFTLERRTENVLLLHPFSVSDPESGADALYQLWNELKSRFHHNFEEIQSKSTLSHRFAFQTGRTQHIHHIYEHQLPQHIPIITTPANSTMIDIPKPILSINVNDLQPLPTPSTETRKIVYSTKLYQYPQYPYTHLISQHTFETKLQQYLNNNHNTTHDTPSNEQINNPTISSNDNKHHNIYHSNTNHNEVETISIAEKLFYLPQLYDWNLYHGCQIPQFPFAGLPSLLYYKTDEFQFEPIQTNKNDTTPVKMYPTDYLPRKLPYSLHWVSLKQLRRHVFIQSTQLNEEHINTATSNSQQEQQEHSPKISIIIPTRNFNEYLYDNFDISNTNDDSPTLGKLCQLSRQLSNPVNLQHIHTTTNNNNNETLESTVDPNSIPQIDGDGDVTQIDGDGDVTQIDGDGDVTQIDGDDTPHTDDGVTTEADFHNDNDDDDIPQFRYFPSKLRTYYKQLHKHPSIHEDGIKMVSVVENIVAQLDLFFNSTTPQLVSYLIDFAWPLLCTHKPQHQRVPFNSYTIREFEYINTKLMPIVLQKLQEQLTIIQCHSTTSGFSFIYQQQPNQHIWNSLAVKQLRSIIIRTAQSEDLIFKTPPINDKKWMGKEKRYISNQIHVPYLHGSKCDDRDTIIDNDGNGSKIDNYNNSSFNQEHFHVDTEGQPMVLLATTITGDQFPLSSLAVTTLVSTDGILQHYQQLLDQFDAKDRELEQIQEYQREMEQQQLDQKFRDFEEEFQQQLLSHGVNY